MTSELETAVTGLRGQDLVAMLASATANLERHAAEVNALNVFPVPDGDTGTNMLATIRSSLDAAASVPEDSAYLVAGAMTRGALMGARGNSGVILSQIIAGFGTVLQETEAEILGGVRFARALRAGSDQAYRAVTQPVEGTILTVARRAAEAAEAAPDTFFLTAVRASIDAARVALADTPNQLKVLKDAGVVDSGGAGLVYILEGILLFLEGTPVTNDPRDAVAMATELSFANLDALELIPYGYCTEFMVSGFGLEPEGIRDRMQELGESVLVVGTDSLVRIHVHTFDPGAALTFATQIGSLSGIKIDNMQDQAAAFQSARQERTRIDNLGIVAVAPGNGFARVLRSLGVHQVIMGGQTMNPSIQDFLDAARSVTAERLIFLPNNRNVQMAAEKAAEQIERPVTVIPTRSVIQGISAMVAYNPVIDPEEAISEMAASIDMAATVEITQAVRPSRVEDIEIREGDFLTLLDDKIIGTARTVREAVQVALDPQHGAAGDIVTVYYGAEATRTEAENIAQVVRQARPGAEVEVVSGGQPHYPIVLSIE